MFVDLILMVLVLILSLIIKRKWFSVAGSVFDGLLVLYHLINVGDIFYNVPSDGGAAVGYMIGLSMYGPIVLILLVLMVAILIGQIVLINKYNKGRD